MAPPTPILDAGCWMLDARSAHLPGYQMPDTGFLIRKKKSPITQMDADKFSNPRIGSQFSIPNSEFRIPNS
jgi:hypothetical protein